MPSVPDKPELNLTGQIISVTLPITDPVCVDCDVDLYTHAYS